MMFHETQSPVATVEDYHQQSLLLRSILESPKGVIIFSLDTHYCYTSFTTVHFETMKAIWGVEISVGINMLDVISQREDKTKAKENFDKALKGEYLVLHEEYGDDALSRKFWENRYSPMFNEIGEIVGLTVFVTDITEHKRAEENLRKALVEKEILLERERLLNSIGEGVYGVDLEGHCIFINPMALQILGFEKEEVIGKNTHALFHHHYPDGTAYPERECIIHKVVALHKQDETKEWLFHKNGTTIPVRIIATPIIQNEVTSGVVIAFNDITVQNSMEEALQNAYAILEQEAKTDYLTQIYNRRYMEETAPKVIEELYGQGIATSFIAFDIDHFKQINDSLGHSGGDTVLVMVTNIVKAKLRMADIFIRMGGDEFSIILPNTKLDMALDIARRIKEAIETTVRFIEKKSIVCTISMGVVETKMEAIDYGELLKRADKKLYEAKNSGRNCIRF